MALHPLNKLKKDDLVNAGQSIVFMLVKEEDDHPYDLFIHAFLRLSVLTRLGFIGVAAVRCSGISRRDLVLTCLSFHSACAESSGSLQERGE